jgi:hypothetical protein
MLRISQLNQSGRMGSMSHCRAVSRNTPHSNPRHSSNDNTVRLSEVCVCSVIGSFTRQKSADAFHDVTYLFKETISYDFLIMVYHLIGHRYCSVDHHCFKSVPKSYSTNFQSARALDILKDIVWNCWICGSTFKGIVQRKLRWFESGVNRWVMLQYWGAGH